jgi:hypothetical protein
MAFGLLFGSLGSMFGFFWKFLIATSGILGIEGILGIGDSIGAAGLGPFAPAALFVAAMALVPLFVMAGMFIHAAILHLLLLLVRGGNSGFQGTFRVIAYSQAAQVWGVIPFVGGWIGGVWQLIVQAIGLREIHETSYVRIFLAFLIPAAVVLFLVIAVAALFLHALFQSVPGRQFF